MSGLYSPVRYDDTGDKKTNSYPRSERRRRLTSSDVEELFMGPPAKRHASSAYRAKVRTLDWSRDEIENDDADDNTIVSATTYAAGGYGVPGIPSLQSSEAMPNMSQHHVFGPMNPSSGQVSSQFGKVAALEGDEHDESFDGEESADPPVQPRTFLRATVKSSEKEDPFVVSVSHIFKQLPKCPAFLYRNRLFAREDPHSDILLYLPAVNMILLRDAKLAEDRKYRTVSDVLQAFHLIGASISRAFNGDAVTTISGPNIESESETCHEWGWTSTQNYDVHNPESVKTGSYFCFLIQWHEAPNGLKYMQIRGHTFADKRQMTSNEVRSCGLPGAIIPYGVINGNGLIPDKSRMSTTKETINTLVLCPPETQITECILRLGQLPDMDLCQGVGSYGFLATTLANLVVDRSTWTRR